MGGGRPSTGRDQQEQTDAERAWGRDGLRPSLPRRIVKVVKWAGAGLRGDLNAGRGCVSCVPCGRPAAAVTGVARKPNPVISAW